MATLKGFIKDWSGNKILPITRAELVLDQDGKMALTSKYFEAGYTHADGTKNEYGLISAVERALISGGNEGQSIKDIYDKLGYINTGLSFNNTSLNFYNTASNATPINISASNGVSLVVVDNNVQLGLTELNSTETKVAQILKSITVDKYGRVTAVSGSALINADIPQELINKTIKNGTLDGCTTSVKDIGTNELAVANKAYVDEKFNAANGVATGALKFGGSISTSTAASNALTNDDNWNSYYKVTGTAVEISESDLEDTAGLTIIGGKYKAKPGDTLIVYPPDTGTKATFICIPSADDVTRLTVKGDGETSAAFESKDGNITLRFSELFSVTNPVSGTASALISIPIATSTQDGYLSKKDYALFQSYASNLSVSYTGEFSSGEGVYKIGTLKIGSANKDIYGKNNISSLTLNNGSTSGTNQTLNPILKFTETGASDVNIAFKGVSGINVTKNGNNVEFQAVNTVASDSTDYLTIQGSQFGVKLGSVDQTTKEITEGLVNFSTIHNLAVQVSKTAVIEEIDYTLKGTDTSKYQYGNDKLKTAITLTI